MPRVYLSCCWLVVLFAFGSHANCYSFCNRSPAFSPPQSSPLSLAESFYQQRKFDQAINHCLMGLRAAESNRDFANAVAARNLLGACFIKKRMFDEAVLHLQEALRAANDHFSPNHPILSDCHFQLGVYYEETGDVDASVKHHNTALMIREKNFGPNHVEVAESLIGLGELYFYAIQDFRKAYAYFHKAAEIRESLLEAGDFNLYVSHFYMAQVNKRLGENDRALMHAFKAMSVIRSRSEYLPYLERCYTLLGDIYYSMANFPQAIQYLRKGIEQSKRTDGPVNYNLIRKYMNLGAAYYESEDLHQAIACFRESLKIYQGHHHHNSSLRAENALHLGRVFQDLGQFDSARHYLDKCLDLRLKDFGPKHFLTSQAYQYLANLYQSVDLPDSAIHYIQQSIVAGVPGFANIDARSNPSLETMKDRYSLFPVFALKGKIFLNKSTSGSSQLNHLKAALNSFKIADTLMQLSRNSYEQEGSKLFFADHYHNVYEYALRTSYLLFAETGDDNYVTDALMFMERSKAFLLAEALHKAEIFSSAGLPDSLREMERNFNTALATYRSQLESAHTKADAEKMQQRIQAQIFDISQKQEKLLDTIARLYPSYFQIKYQKPSTFTQIQEYAREHDCTILEYFWGDEKVYLLAIAGGKLVFKETGAADSLAQMVQAYFQTLQKPPSMKDRELAFTKFSTSAKNIYNLLLDPLLGDKEHTNLVIIRDGPLLHIPFESLLIGAPLASGDFRDLEYLIRHHTISYAHSADLLLKSATSRKNISGGSSMLAFSFTALNLSAEPSDNQPFNELPGAARELQAIASVLPGTYFFGEEATEEKFKSEAGNFDILHLAVHGRSDPEKQFSGSLFFKPSPDSRDDGELHVYELYDLSLKARLAVLSACESGVGKFFRGEGVFSIARGFAYAGCPSTVMTLWPVSDLTSAGIMADFYRHLGAGDHIDVALRKAKLNYLESADPLLAHPSFWAAYIPTGNMEPVITPTFPARIIWIFVVIAVALLAVILKTRNERKVRPSHTRVPY